MAYGPDSVRYLSRCKLGWPHRCICRSPLRCVLSAVPALCGESIHGRGSDTLGSMGNGARLGRASSSPLTASDKFMAVDPRALQAQASLVDSVHHASLGKPACGFSTVNR